jgi:hypothetical protein
MMKYSLHNFDYILDKVWKDKKLGIQGYNYFNHTFHEFLNDSKLIPPQEETLEKTCMDGKDKKLYIP